MIKILAAFEALPNFRGMSEASSADIDAAEEELGLAFSEDYKGYLKAFSLVSANGHELTGLCESERLNVVSVTQKERERLDGVDPSWYVVERIGVDGAIAWQAHDGSVYRTTPHSSGVKVCDTLFDYMSR